MASVCYGRNENQKTVTDAGVDAAGGENYFPALIPEPERQAVLLQKISAARTAPRIVPRLHQMFRLNRTRQREFLPHQRSSRPATAQNHRRNFRPEKLKKFCHCARPPPHSREDIEQLAAVAAPHGLHLAMQTAVRAARNLRAVLTQRTLE